MQTFWMVYVPHGLHSLAHVTNFEQVYPPAWHRGR